MSIPPDKTQMSVAVEGPKVVIQYSRAVGTQHLTPEHARMVAKALQQAADVAEMRKP